MDEAQVLDGRGDVPRVDVAPLLEPVGNLTRRAVRRLDLCELGRQRRVAFVEAE